MTGACTRSLSTAVVQGMTENCLGTEAPQTRKIGDTWSLNSHLAVGQTFALHSAKTETQPRGRLQPVENLVQKRAFRFLKIPQLRGIQPESR